MMASNGGAVNWFRCGLPGGCDDVAGFRQRAAAIRAHHGEPEATHYLKIPNSLTVGSEIPNCPRRLILLDLSILVLIKH